MEEREIVKKHLIAILGMMSAAEIADVLIKMCEEIMELERRIDEYENADVYTMDGCGE